MSAYEQDIEDKKIFKQLQEKYNLINKQII